VSLAQEIGNAISAEFADLGDAATATTICFRFLLAALLGGMLGYDRERKGKPAGLRTHMLVALGAALFIAAPRLAGFSDPAVARVIQGLIAGIGFLGAGAIMKDVGGEHVEGLTTAASIWMTAALGMTAGMGRAGTAVLAAVFAIVVLAFVGRGEPTFAPRNGQPHGEQPTRRGDDAERS
jgi:putative Mg2+ transporter-C (MgtC) family protein